MQPSDTLIVHRPPRGLQRKLAVRCRGLRKIYTTRRAQTETVAIDHVDLAIERGECFGLLGPNGAGKTTAIEIFEGLTSPTAGEVEVLGKTWGRHADSLRRCIGVALQETRLPDRLSVKECLELFSSFYSRPRTVREVLADIALSAERDALVHTLSGGQRQRLAIGCALVGSPELLFLDEPTTGLDPLSRRQLWDLVIAFRASGGTVLLTTHYMEEAERLCDHVAIMDRGRIVCEGRPVDLITLVGDRHVIEFRVEPGTLERAELLTLPGVTSASRVDETARNWALDATELQRALPALFALAERRRVRVAHLVTRSTTLEDVFVRLTGRHLRDS